MVMHIQSSDVIKLLPLMNKVKKTDINDANVILRVKTIGVTRSDGMSMHRLRVSRKGSN